jgi:hypothetical protein
MNEVSQCEVRSGARLGEAVAAGCAHPCRAVRGIFRKGYANTTSS